MGMRQWLVHAYFKLDLDQPWKTIEDALSPLITQLNAILSEDKAE